MLPNRMRSGLMSSNAYAPEAELFMLMSNAFLAEVIKRASLFAIKFNLHHKRRIGVGVQTMIASMKVIITDRGGHLAKFQEAFLEFHEHKSLTPEFLDTHPEVKRVLEEHMPAFFEKSVCHKLENGRPMSEKETCAFLMDYLFVDADSDTDTDRSENDSTPDTSEEQKNSESEFEKKNTSGSGDEKEDEIEKQELQMLDPSNAAGIEQCRCDFCNTMRECSQTWDTWIPEETEQWKICLRDALNL